MNKKITYILVILICFISFISFTYAEEKDAYISCSVAPDGLNLRNNIDGSITNYLSCGNDLIVLDSTLGSSSICDNWYKVKVDDATGYVKKIYISTEKVAYSEKNKLNV